MITGALKSQIDQIWNTFWTGGISNTITIVEQLTYLMFIKDLDETETRNERKAKRLKPITRLSLGKISSIFAGKISRKWMCKSDMRYSIIP